MYVYYSPSSRALAQEILTSIFCLKTKSSFTLFHSALPRLIGGKDTFLILNTPQNIWPISVPQQTKLEKMICYFTAV